MCGHRRYDEVRIRADDVRPSDTEREEIISRLRFHAGEGRLDVEELDARIDRAYAARTRRHLVALTKDLPRRPRDRRREANEHLRSYLSVMALLVAIWALSGGGYFWPIWPIVIWGFFVLPSVVRGPGGFARRSSQART